MTTRSGGIRLGNERTGIDMDTASPRAPLALLASAQEWSSRSLESILAPSGYAVLHAFTARETLDRARRGQPDVILLDAQLPDRDGMAVCRALRDDPQLSRSTPILVLTSGPPTKQLRLAALRAGAWELLTLPVDAEELLLKLESYIQAKVEADRAREEGLVDAATGLYNVRGLARRARELGSDAFRHHAALACVVFGTDLSPGKADEEAQLSTEFATVVQRSGRVSDAIGVLGRTEFAIIAPATDAGAAVRLAERLLEAFTTAAPQAHRSPAIRVGYEAVDDVHATAIEPVDLLIRATTALRLARAEGNGNRIRRYEPHDRPS